MQEASASRQIDDIIALHGGWKAEILSQVRRAILATDSAIAEEVKWKTPSRPEGLPTWTHRGIVCYAEIWRDNVKLLFAKGAQLPDPDNLFNARLKSTDIRAIEFREGDVVDQTKLEALVLAAIERNRSK